MTKTANLEENLRGMQIHASPRVSDELIAVQEQLQKERESIVQCLAICTQASKHLREFNNDLQIHSPHISDDTTIEQRQIKEERESTEQCLATCAKASEHIGQFQTNLSEELGRGIVGIPGGLISSIQATLNALQECQDILTNATIDLEKQFQKINSRLQTLFEQGAGM